MKRTSFLHFKLLICILIFYLIIIGTIASRYDFNLSCFVNLGEKSSLVTKKLVPPNFVIMKNISGYDGQAYYYAASDPFIKTNFHRIDLKKYQRFLYPFLAYILALGNKALLPLTLLIVNIISILVGTLFLSIILKKHNVSIWYALIYSLGIGNIVAFQYNLTTPLFLCLILIGIYFYEEKKIASTALFFSLALLTREIAGLIILVFLMYEFFEKRYKNSFVIILSFIPFILLQFFLYQRLGEIPILGSSGHITLPFAGIIQEISSINLSGGGIKHILREISVIPYFCFVMLVLAVSIVKLLRNKNIYNWNLFVQAFVPIFMCFSIWEASAAATRITFAIFPFMILSYAKDRDKLSKYLFIGAGLLTVAVIIRILFISPVHPYYLS
ncbi:hypothetical protein KKC91_07360 [bacterium]|nr:hypothetical protein [bacterium]